MKFKLYIEDEIIEKIGKDYYSKFGFEFVECFEDYVKVSNVPTIEINTLDELIELLRDEYSTVEIGIDTIMFKNGLRVDY